MGNQQLKRQPNANIPNIPARIQWQNKQLKKQANVHCLNIPARLQWQNGHGFCGQTCMQSISLFFGGYISQNQVRRIAESQFLVGENAEQAVDKLGFEYQAWDNESPQPQYKNYLQWIKNHISQGHPVIVTGYYAQDDNEEYDHIYLAVGVKSNNFEQYSDDDQLIYADLFDKEYIRTPFGKIWDTRSMKGNGKALDFAFPKDVNFGIAVKGIKDPEEMFLPVRLQLKEIKQPNVSTGEPSVQFRYRVNVSDLEEGKKYALLRYDTYKKIPIDSVAASQSSNVIEFIAKQSTYVIEDSVESSKMVYYRCVQAEDLQ